MEPYDVYLEIGREGKCMAHVPELPGCMVRAASQEEALAALPQAIMDYHGWLRNHGEEVAPVTTVTLAVVETVKGCGPFAHGDAAALFAPDRQPLGREELELYLRRADCGREDLLSLVQHLPDEVFEWQPQEETMSIRSILRHLGNAEEWYVSRLAPPQTLPPAWENDEALPILSFLEMERRTAVERLRRLTDEERAQVIHPGHWSDHPDEAWTARKALRRLLEHQFEHTAQVRDALAARRRHFRARLIGNRAQLLYRLLGLDEETLHKQPVFADTTAVELLAHVAAWDGLYTKRMKLVLEGRVEEIRGVELDDRNAALHDQYKEWPLARALQFFLEARREFLQTLVRVGDGAWYRPLALPWGDTTSLVTWSLWRARHDAVHAADLLRWRQENRFTAAAGPRSLLVAALEASRDEIAALVALVPEAERRTRRLHGEGTLKDILGHLADWEAFAVSCLRAGRLLELGYADEQAHNEARAAAWRAQPWSQVTAAFAQVRQELLQIVAHQELATPLPNPWGADTIYGWAHSFLAHERHHGAALRATLVHL